MEKYRIHIPSDVCRESTKRQAKFITEQRRRIIQSSIEYKEDKLQDRAAQNNAHLNVHGAEHADAALRLASSFLAALAAEDNAVLELRCERNRVAEKTEKAEEGVKKCKKETMEALLTFL
ncbi:hypothetical protein V8C42DRAFT_258853 [Trichoderma barbatum]